MQNRFSSNQRQLHQEQKQQNCLFQQHENKNNNIIKESEEIEEQQQQQSSFLWTWCIRIIILMVVALQGMFMYNSTLLLKQQQEQQKQSSLYMVIPNIKRHTSNLPKFQQHHHKQQQQQLQLQQITQHVQHDSSGHDFNNSIDMAEIKPHNNNKTLVMLTGSLRCGESAWESLIRNVLDVNMADLFVSTSDDTPEWLRQNSSLIQRAKYVYYKPEYKDWGDALALIDPNWRNKITPLYNPKNILLGPIQIGKTKIFGSGALVFYERWFLSNKIQELKLTEQYDRFVVTRTDHTYMCPLDLSTMDNSKIWVPQGQDWRGICDRFFISNSSSILPALNIFPALFENPTKYSDILANEIGNTEMLLLQRWQEEQLTIERFHRNMYVCAAGGDSTRGRKHGDFRSNTGVYVKYYEEYNLAVDTCRIDTEKYPTKPPRKKKTN